MQLVNPWENIKIEKVNNGELYFFDNHIHLIYVLIGDASLNHEDQYFVLQKDDFLIVPKAQSYSLSSKNAEVFHLTLSYEVTMNNKDTDIEYIFQGNSVEHPQTADYEVVKFINSILQLYVFKEYNQNAFVYQNYFGLIGILEKNYRKKIVLDRKKSAIKKIEELKFYIDNNFNKEIKLSEIASSLFLSEQYLSRLFSKEIGISISDYTIQKRLEKVRNELLHTEKSVIDIAYEAGFSNINSFNRIFKKNQGMTPSDYRKEVKQGIVVTTAPETMSEPDFNELKRLIEKKATSDAGERKTIQIDMENRRNYEMQFLINLGYAADLLHYKLAQQILANKQKINFSYGRIWGLLSPEIIGDYQGELDFSQVDLILDTVIQAGMTPFLELGFKGKTIYSDYRTLIENHPFSKGGLSLEDYLAVIEKFFSHCLSRYGYAAVASWKIEVWKPQKIVLQTISALHLSEVTTNGRTLKIVEDKPYFYFFSQISQRIKKIIPEIAVGGCGISVEINNSSVGDFIRAWKNEKNHPDFFSVGVFPMDEIKSDFTEEKRKNPISPDIYFMSRHIKTIRKSLDQSQLEIPLYITEFNVTILNRDLINDTIFKGNYIIKNVIEVLPYCQMVGYWLYSDAATVATDVNGREIFGGSGLLTQNGIPKSGFHAYVFLTQMTGQVIHSSEDLLVTMPDPYTINVLATHYAHLNSSYYYNSQGSFRKENIYTIFNNKLPRSVKLSIQLPTWLAASKVKIKTKNLLPERGGHLEEIIKLRTDQSLDAEEINYLMMNCIPEMHLDYFQVNDRLSLNYEIETHEILFKSIQFIN